MALAYLPALRRALPRPGEWMATLRRILAVPMFLTALALAWVLGREAGVTGMTLGLAAALSAGLALWWFGARQRDGGGALAPLGFGLACRGCRLVHRLSGHGDAVRGWRFAWHQGLQ